MRIKDLKQIINKFNDNCLVEFEDDLGKRHQISIVKSDRCLCYWTLLFSEKFHNKLIGQEIIWHNR